METALMFAETVFYLTASAAIITIGVLCAMVTRRLLRIAQELEELSCNLKFASNAASERIHDIVNRLSDFPFLSYFLKKRPATGEGKGRGEVPKNK